MDRGTQTSQGNGKPSLLPKTSAPNNQTSADSDDGWTIASSSKKARAPPLQAARAPPQIQATNRPHMLLRPGMKIGPGSSLPGGARAEENLRLPTGSGTTADPRLQWNWNINKQGFSPQLIRDCEALVRAEAIKLGLPFAIIR